jgi:hypothetical protein
MHVLPRCGKEWLPLVLLPFKVFVPAGYLFVVVEKRLATHTDAGAVSLMAGTVLDIYMLSFLVLAVSGAVQRTIGPAKAHRSTWLFAAGVPIFSYLLLPYFFGH